ncbi:MAG: outer membrane lipoprotein-sorting protein [Verrucomicrobiota bacterium]
MKLTLRSLGSALLAATALISNVSAQDAAPSAKELAKSLAAGIQDGSSVVRLKLETPSKTVLQLQIKSRRTSANTELVYQVLWPKERKGEGFLLKKPGSRATTGTLLVLPNTLKNLTASELKDGIFGSDLSYEDLVENFYAWDDQAIIGTEVVDRVPCQVLESKPGGRQSPYSKVQSWIDVKRMVPLRVDKYGSSGKLERRVLTTRVAKDDNGRQIPAGFSVQGADLGSPTVIDGSSSKHDAKLTDADFEPTAIGDLK